MRTKYQPIGINMSPCTNALGSLLRAERLAQGKTQTEIAEKGNFTQSDWSSLERGKRVRITKPVIVRLAKTIGYSVKELTLVVEKDKPKVYRTELAKIAIKQGKLLGYTENQTAKKLGTTLFLLNHRKSLYLPEVRRWVKVLQINPNKLFPFVLCLSINNRGKCQYAKFGLYFRKARFNSHLSIRQASKKLGITKQMLSRVELGQESLIRSDILISKMIQLYQLDPITVQKLRPKKQKNCLRATNTLGALLTSLRKLHKLTQEEFAQQCHVCTAYVGKVERNTTTPSKNYLEKVKKHFLFTIPLYLDPYYKH